MSIDEVDSEEVYWDMVECSVVTSVVAAHRRILGTDLKIFERRYECWPRCRPEWKCDRCGEMVPGTFDVCWNCTGVEEPVFQREVEEPVFQREDDDVPSGAMVCPFCGGKMNRGHIWVSGGGGSGVLEWQEGCQIKRGLFGKIADATLSVRRTSQRLPIRPFVVLLVGRC